MKYLRTLLIISILTISRGSLIAQTASILEKEVQILTYPYSDPDPVPQFGKIFPYFRYDGYALNGSMRNWKVVEMENDYIKLWVIPEIGGKIWGAVEKSTGKEFVYYNHAVKFRDVALRGPWTSGGIEINFGIIGHAPTSSNPVDYLIRKNEDGSVSCFVGAIDLCSRTRWSVEIVLPKDKAYFTTRSRWDNPTGLDQAYYHWMNMGIKTAGNLEYVFPGNYFLGHDGKSSLWPIDKKGRNLAFYEENNFGGSKSYHVFGGLTGFYGAYWHNDNFGFAHYSEYDDKPGKKIWIWGLSDQGMIWEDLLTDKDGQYTEVQSGRLFNQAGEGSSSTPFKNRDFAAGSTDEWLEYWLPIKGTRGLKYSLPTGSINFIQKDNNLNLWFCPNEKVVGNLEARDGTEKIFSKEISCNPLQLVNESFIFKGELKNLTIWIDNKCIFNQLSGRTEINRPVETPADFKNETAFGHYLKGKEFERQRFYKNAEAEYSKTLEIEPWYVPALTGMANLYYRKTDYSASLKYSLKALSIDTYDGYANMIYGLAEQALGNTASAIDGFSIASADISLRTAAYNSLSSVFLAEGDFSKSLDYAEKSLNYNTLSSEANQLKALCLRKLGKQNEANTEIGKLEEKDPLNHFGRIERFLINPDSESKKLIQSHITNDMPYESYLEYALWYFKNGQVTDALKVLELSPENPIVLIWTGYLNHLSGKEQLAKDALTKALSINPQFVFPFRAETLKPLGWAQTISDNWKLNYYTGIIYLYKGDNEKGEDYWNRCTDAPDFYPFYFARSRLYGIGSQEALNDVERALKLAGNNWRAGMFASKFYLERGNIPKAEELAQNFYVKFPQNYYLGLHYAKVMEINKEYSVCINLLKKILVLPNEGATEGRTIWRNANIGNALYQMKSRNYRKALENIDLSREWPVNLGVGKPYLVDERLQDYMALQCLKKLKDTKAVVKMQDKITGDARQQNLSYDAVDLLTALVLKDMGNNSKADEIIKEMLNKSPLSKLILWCNAIYSENPEQAENIAREVDSSDRTFIFLSNLFNGSGIFKKN
jgi:tetratricopeptide (TPR) repeat protein